MSDTKVVSCRKAGGYLAIAVFVVLCLVVANVGLQPSVVERRAWVRQIGWGAVADYNPGAGLSGWLNMTVYDHMSTPAGIYAANLTNNASSFAWTNVNNTHAGSDVPYGNTFDLVLKVRLNVSDGFSSGNSTWMPSWVRANVTCPALGLADVGMTRVVIGDNATFMWLHFYVNGGGAGYTIGKGQNVTVCSFSVDIMR